MLTVRSARVCASAAIALVGIAVVLGALAAQRPSAVLEPAGRPSVLNQDYRLKLTPADADTAKEALSRGQSVQVKRRADGYYEVVGTQPWKPGGGVEETVPLPTGKPFSETGVRE